MRGGSTPPRPSLRAFGFPLPTRPVARGGRFPPFRRPFGGRAILSRYAPLEAVGRSAASRRLAYPVFNRPTVSRPVMVAMVLLVACGWTPLLASFRFRLRPVRAATFRAWRYTRTGDAFHLLNAHRAICPIRWSPSRAPLPRYAFAYSVPLFGLFARGLSVSISLRCPLPR